MTLFDTLRGLNDIAVEKARLSGNSMEEMLKLRGIISEIADEFCGGSKYSRETTRTLTGAMLRIKPEALRTLGFIINETDIELTKKMLGLSSSEIVSRSNECSIYDDRVYRNIISTNTLRRATVFLGSNESDQVNALKRLKNSFEANRFKCFQASRLDKEAERSAKARKQVSLMCKLMGRDTWPEQMLDVQKKLLYSSVFDHELDEYEINANVILQSLVSAYRLRMPLEAGIRWVLHCREENIATNAQTAQHNGESGDSRPIQEDGYEDDQDEANDGANPAEERAYCPLEKLGIKCLNMTLEDFSVKRNPDEERFHLVMGDPTQLHLNGVCKAPIDVHRADKIVGILKSLVLPHGWVFFYTRPVDYYIWDKAFRGNEFDPLDFAWPMVRDCETVQMNTSPLPQNVTELMIGARKRYPDTPNFEPDISSQYERNVSSRKRKFAIMDYCPEPTIKLKKPNTREPVRKNERSSDVIAEFVKTFCPENGNVLDAFSGTMETAKGCFLASRCCTALEADRMCFDLSLERLKESAAAYLASTANGLASSDEIEEYLSNERRAESLPTTEAEEHPSSSEESSDNEGLGKSAS